MKTNFSYNIMFATLITLLFLALGCTAHNAESVEGIYEAATMSNGAEALFYKYEAVQSFSNGVAAVCLDGKWGFIDETGSETISCQYDYVQPFSEELAAFMLGDWNTAAKWGFVDKKGELFTPLTYDCAEDFSNGLAAANIGAESYNNVYVGGKWGFVDKQGEATIPFIYGQLYQIDTNDGSGQRMGFSDGAAAVCLDGKWGFINEANEIVVPFGKYDYVCPFYNGMAQVAQNGKFGFINTSGRETVPCRYDWAGRFSEGLAAVGICELGRFKYGFVDEAGRIAVPIEYDAIGASYSAEPNVIYEGFSEGRIAVSVGAYEYEDDGSYYDGKWGFIDETGRHVF